MNQLKEIPIVFKQIIDSSTEELTIITLECKDYSDCPICLNAPCEKNKEYFDIHKEKIDEITNKLGFRKALKYMNRLYDLLMPICRVGKNCEHIYDIQRQIRILKVDISLDTKKEGDTDKYKVKERIKEINLYIAEFLDILQVITNNTKSMRAEKKFDTDEEIRFHIEILKELPKIKGLNIPATMEGISKGRKTLSRQEDTDFMVNRILKTAKSQEGLKDLTGKK